MGQVNATRRCHLLALTLLVIALLASVRHPAGASGPGGSAGQGSDAHSVAYERQEPGRDCPGEAAHDSDSWLCPATGDEGYAYIESLFADADSNGIAVAFTDDGMDYARSCDGAEALAGMVAQLYERLPAGSRAEESIAWAIPQMTGEINGHARIYHAATSDVVRNAANPVNIVFPEYRGEFRGGANGLNSWAQQIYYGSLCP